MTGRVFWLVHTTRAWISEQAPSVGQGTALCSSFAAWELPEASSFICKSTTSGGEVVGLIFWRRKRHPSPDVYVPQLGYINIFPPIFASSHFIIFCLCTPIGVHRPSQHRAAYNPQISSPFVAVTPPECCRCVHTDFFDQRSGVPGNFESSSSSTALLNYGMVTFAVCQS